MTALHAAQPCTTYAVQDSTHNSMFDAKLDHSVNMTLQPWKHKAPAKCVAATRVDVFPTSTQGRCHGRTAAGVPQQPL